MGQLTIKTDFDFSIRFMGNIHFDDEIVLEINSAGDIGFIDFLGAWGSELSRTTPIDEVVEQLEEVVRNFDKPADYTRGDRGIKWEPNTEVRNRVLFEKALQSLVERFDATIQPSSDGEAIVIEIDGERQEYGFFCPTKNW